MLNLIRLSLLITLLLPVQSWAGSMTLLGVGSAGAAAPTCCMLDGITTGIKAAYSTRKLLTAYAGNAIQIERASDSTTQNIGFTSNVLNTSAVNTFCSGTTCRVITWYDQSGGSANLTQGTFANAPIIYQSGSINFINSTRPAPLFTNVGNLSLTNASLSSLPVNTLFQNAVVAVSQTGQGSYGCITGGTSNFYLDYRISNTANDPDAAIPSVAALGTSSLAVVTTGSIAEFQYNATTGAGQFWVDAASGGTFTNAQAGLSNTGITVGSNVANEGLNGSMGELVLYDQVGSFASRTTVEANQKAYWGTP